MKSQIGRSSYFIFKILWTWMSKNINSIIYILLKILIWISNVQNFWRFFIVSSFNSCHSVLSKFQTGSMKNLSFSLVFTLFFKLCKQVACQITCSHGTLNCYSIIIDLLLFTSKLTKLMSWNYVNVSLTWSMVVYWWYLICDILLADQQSQVSQKLIKFLDFK